MLIPLVPALKKELLYIFVQVVKQADITLVIRLIYVLRFTFYHIYHKCVKIPPEIPIFQGIIPVFPD